MTSTLKADLLQAKTTDGAISIKGDGTGKVSLGDGNLLWPDADGSSSGDVLQTNASGVLSFAAPAAGGAWTLIATVVASNSASLDVTGLDSTYDTYACVFSDIVHSADSRNPCFRLGDSSGFDSGGSDYGWIHLYQNTGSLTPNGNGTASSSVMKGDINVGTDTAESVSGMFYLHQPGDSVNYPSIAGHAVGSNTSGVLELSYFVGRRNAVIAVDRVQYLANVGNVASGRFSVYGIKHT